MRWIRLPVLFFIGGLIYLLTELLWRGRSHWTMFIVGGFCFIVTGAINEVLSWETSLIIQCVIGAVGITITEFISGIILNIWLKWNIWDYSNMPGNILGQICPQYFLLWILISGVAIVLDDYIRYKFFGEDKPRYKI